MAWIVQCIEPPRPDDYSGIERIVSEAEYVDLTREEAPREVHDQIEGNGTSSTYVTEYAGERAELIPINPDDPNIERHVRTEESREELDLLNQPNC